MAIEMKNPLNEMSAVDYFRAKLSFETTPYGLKDDMGKKKDVFILDVRSREGFAKEHIPGATNIPLSELENQMKTLPRDKTIVAYCWDITCAAAPKAALRLAEKGFNVKELFGGIEEWKKKEMPVEGKG